MENRPPLDAVVMAGGLCKWRGLKQINKNLLKVRGKPLFYHALSALMQADRFRRIYVVGPKSVIENEISKAGGRFPKEVVVLQEADSLVNNLMLAFRDSVGAKNDKDLENPEIAERAIFAVSGDAPLLTTDEVGQFLDNCDLGKYDYCIGMTPDTVLAHYRTKGLKLGISLAYVHFVEGNLRVNNMHLAKPLKIKNRQDLDEFYKIRHLKKIKNIFALALGLYKRNMGFRDWVGLLRMYLAMWSGKGGLKGLASRLSTDITYTRVEDVVSHFLGARVKMVVTTLGGAAVDVDKPGNLRVIGKRYDEWMALQKRFAEGIRKNGI